MIVVYYMNDRSFQLNLDEASLQTLQTYGKKMVLRSYTQHCLACWITNLWLVFAAHLLRTAVKFSWRHQFTFMIQHKRICTQSYKFVIVCLDWSLQHDMAGRPRAALKNIILGISIVKKI